MLVTLHCFISALQTFQLFKCWLSFACLLYEFLFYPSENSLCISCFCWFISLWNPFSLAIISVMCIFPWTYLMSPHTFWDDFFSFCNFISRMSLSPFSVSLLSSCSSHHMSSNCPHIFILSFWIWFVMLFSY